MKQAILDTDTVSCFFRQNQEVIDKLDHYLIEFGFVNISVVTFYEVKNGLYYRDAKSQLAKFEKFVELNQVLPLSEEVADQAASIYANLRQTGKTIAHNDVMIGATATVNDMVLITNNLNHFSRIRQLEIDNWIEQ